MKNACGRLPSTVSGLVVSDRLDENRSKQLSIVDPGFSGKTWCCCGYRGSTMDTPGQQQMFDNCWQRCGESDLSGEMFVNCNDSRYASDGQPLGNQPAPLLSTGFCRALVAVSGLFWCFFEEIFVVDDGAFLPE